ncbi:MAG: gliding motility-associated C-terminal domain-containing protein [Williamsia sp.]|nr:gliding motility-associated C-terminal domain-containing protein [Williamsia sp.]
MVPAYIAAQSVVPGFTMPDTVCVNTALQVSNTSTGASSYFWNFCVADVNALPSAISLGNPGNYLSQPVFIDQVEDNGKYYGFVVNHGPGGITRLDFGNSLLNTPTPVFLGNVGGVMNAGYGSEGIQIIKANGKWYGLLVGGSPASGPGSVPKLITIYFGTSLDNPAPTAKDWGNLGNMLQSIDLHVFQENNNWYGFTTNAENNTITRINFTNSFDNPPTATNLGNIGGLTYPTGVYAINDNGTWRVFVTNETGNSISRLDFGNSLLNTPTGVNLGSLGNLINAPRDITILKLCGQAVGFVVEKSNRIIRLNFNSLVSTPLAADIGNVGTLNFPHSLSKLFRSGNDIYCLITNVSNNTITRLKFSGCTSSSIPNSTAQNPPPVVYGTPGIYNINLTVDDGLPTQNTLCKQVVVAPPPTHSPTRNFSICNGTALKIGSSIRSAKYSWSTGAASDSIVVLTPGTYWVESAKYGCAVRDSFIVSLASGPSSGCDSVKITGKDKVCSSSDTVTYTIYKSPACQQQYTFQADSSFATIVAQTASSVKLLFKKNGTTSLKAAYTNNCKVVADSITISIKFSPNTVNLGPDIVTCRDTTLVLHADSRFSSYLWQNGTTDSTLVVNTPGTYSVVAQNMCNVQYKDTFNLTRNAGMSFKAQPASPTVCPGDSLQFYASGGTSYAWQPASSFNRSTSASPRALIKASQNITVLILDSVCKRDTVITLPVSLLPKAQIAITKSNDISCINASAVLTATGGTTYTWSPDLHIIHRTNESITVNPQQTITYYVQSRNLSGCVGQDSVKISFLKEGDQKLSVPNAFTPNGDGVNDVFRPVFSGPASKYNFTVYNRWGQLLFKSSTVQAGWDGTYHAILQPQGIYVYYITAEGSCSGLFERKGTFLLIRSR